MFGYKLNDAGIANKETAFFLGYTGRVYEALLGCKETYLSFFNLLLKVGAGSPVELRNALFELREAGALVLTKNVETLEHRIIPLSPSPAIQPHEVRMAEVRSSLREAVIRGSTDQIDLAELQVLIEDHRRLSNKDSISQAAE